MPLETAGNETEAQPRSFARRKAASRAFARPSSSRPRPWCGPTAWMTPLNGSRPAVVTTASPTTIVPRCETMRAPSSSSSGPAARAMAAATPPPWARWPFAAFTIASTGSERRSPVTTSKVRPPGYCSRAITAAPRSCRASGPSASRGALRRPPRSCPSSGPPRAPYGMSSTFPVVCRPSRARWASPASPSGYVRSIRTWRRPAAASPSTSADRASRLSRSAM